MTEKEYKEGYAALVKESSELDERSTLQLQQSNWLANETSKLLAKITKGEDNLPWDEKEKLTRVAEELMGRMRSEQASIRRDQEKLKALDKKTQEFFERAKREGVSD